MRKRIDNDALVQATKQNSSNEGILADAKKSFTKYKIYGNIVDSDKKAVLVELLLMKMRHERQQMRIVSLFNWLIKHVHTHILIFADLKDILMKLVNHYEDKILMGYNINGHKVKGNEKSYDEQIQKKKRSLWIVSLHRFTKAMKYK